MTYLYTKAAYLLLFKDDKGYKAIRVEVPDLELEFTDGIYIGRDPVGVLWYNKVDDLKRTGTHYYDVHKEIVNSITHAVVYFRYGSATATPYAKFDATDRFDTVSGMGMDNYSHTGDWQKFDVSFSMATIKKDSGSNVVTLEATSIDKTGTFKDTSGILSGTGFSLSGHLFYRKLSNIKQGVFANYNNDRVVFYDDDYTGKDFQSFFMPTEDQPADMGVPPPKTQTFEEVSWT